MIKNTVMQRQSENSGTKTTINIDDDEEDLNNITKKQKTYDNDINKTEVKNNAENSNNDFLNMMSDNTKSFKFDNDEYDKNKNQLLNRLKLNIQNDSNCEPLQPQLTSINNPIVTSGIENKQTIVTDKIEVDIKNKQEAYLLHLPTIATKYTNETEKSEKFEIDYEDKPRDLNLENKNDTTKFREEKIEISPVKTVSENEDKDNTLVKDSHENKISQIENKNKKSKKQVQKVKQQNKESEKMCCVKNILNKQQNKEADDDDDE